MPLCYCCTEDQQDLGSDPVLKDTRSSLSPGTVYLAHILHSRWNVFIRLAAEDFVPLFTVVILFPLLSSPSISLFSQSFTDSPISSSLFAIYCSQSHHHKLLYIRFYPICSSTPRESSYTLMLICVCARVCVKNVYLHQQVDKYDKRQYISSISFVPVHIYF